uniref:Aminopeptidase n=1 Tax=Timema genevievae TaxID=629358 RepID=A0A7R9JTM5_TIMGE|nr:unnamed protein product [Timema genevievae]
MAAPVSAAPPTPGHHGPGQFLAHALLTVRVNTEALKRLIAGMARPRTPGAWTRGPEPHPSTNAITRRRINLTAPQSPTHCWVCRRRRPQAREVSVHDVGLGAQPCMNASEDISMMSIASMSSGGEVTRSLENRTTERRLDLLTLHLENPLQEGGRYRLHLKYKGRLSKALSGFYRVAYTDKANITSWLATTTFEPTEARRAFPCFDEPIFKARFQINLARPDSLSTLSNMPLRSSTADVCWFTPKRLCVYFSAKKPGWVWDHYEESPLMSTYLVSFYVGNLQSAERTLPEGGTPFKVWARPGATDQTRFALSMGPEMLRFLGDYIGVDNPLPKQDILALPSFISDALENWGLISFGEKYLLYQPGVSSSNSQQKIATILGHELAHNWFGNLVTMRWWDDIWLNEGFATYFSTLAVNHVRPEWDIHSLYAVNSFLKVFSVDALHTSHPLIPSADTPSDLHQLFDAITYFKGYYMLRMLNHTLGESTFQKGCTRYLKSHQYSNPSQDDLWEHLTAQSHEDGALPDDMQLSDVMRSWTSETGYPVITVTRNYSDGTAQITQTRFLRPKEDVEGRTKSGDINGTSWWIPLTFTSEEELDFDTTSPRRWLDPSQEYTTLDEMPGDDKWVMFNLKASSLYRIKYDEKNWQLIAQFLDSPSFYKIHFINRAHLLDDVLDFARAGQLDYPVALDLTNYLYREDHYLPWKAALSNLGYISRMIRSTDSGDKFKNFLRRLVSPQFDKLGMESQKGETLLETLQRRQISRWACSAGHGPCIKEAVDKFGSWMAEGDPDKDNPISGDLRSLVYCTAVENGGEVEWRFLRDRYEHANFSGETARLLSAMACSRDASKLNALLNWSIQRGSIRKEDSTVLFKAVARREEGHDIAKAFLKEKTQDIFIYAGSDPFHVPKLLEVLASRMNTPTHLKELEDFQNEHLDTLRTESRSVQQANEMVKFNVGWLGRNYGPITKWLDEREV